jgi:hypothetical protein
MAIRIEKDDIIFQGTTKNLILPLKNTGLLVTTTPDIRDNEFWKASDGSAIVEFRFGAPAQRLHILGDGITTVTNSVFIKTITGGTITLLANRVYRFTFFDGIFYQDA